MLCCELKPTVDNLADDLKQAAAREVRQKRVLANIFVLTNCANPYGIDNLVVIDKRYKTEVYWCGDRVFYWNCGLKRYICGKWTDVLSNEAKTIKAQKMRVRVKDRTQLSANKIAARNFVTC